MPRRLILITLLMVLSGGPAFAEWILLGEAEAGTSVYVDLNTIRRKGDLVKMWTLLDFKTAQIMGGVSSFSTKTQSEFDCSEDRMRNLAKAFFAANMGRGIVLYSDSVEGAWTLVPPASIAQNLMAVACDKDVIRTSKVGGLQSGDSSVLLLRTAGHVRDNQSSQPDCFGDAVNSRGQHIPMGPLVMMSIWVGRGPS
jgi:hypothetical protein